MLTRFLPVDPDRPDSKTLDEAAEIVRSGGLVAFPTETVYGLGADALNTIAVARIFTAKGRPASNPLIVHAPDVAEIQKVVSQWPESAARLAAQFWPGPLTLVLPRSDQIDDLVTAGQDTVAVRVPDSRIALEFLRRVGRPVAAPSANRSTGVSPTTADHVLDDLDGLIEFVIDGGPTRLGLESTVLDLTSTLPRILRPGAITAGQISRVLGLEVPAPAILKTKADEPRRSPGQAEVHYSPKTPIWTIEPAELVRDSRPMAGFALIVAGQEIPPLPGAFDRRVDWSDPVEAARDLYLTLRQWDDGSVALILVVLPPDVDAWRAVRDRLWRASRRWSRTED